MQCKIWKNETEVERWGAENRAGTGTAPIDGPPATRVSGIVMEVARRDDIIARHKGKNQGVPKKVTIITYISNRRAAGSGTLGTDTARSGRLMARTHTRLVMGFVLALCLLLPGAWAIGVAPSSSEHVAVAGDNVSFRIKVLNEGGAPVLAALSPEGVLAPHLALSEGSVRFRSGETERWVSGTLTLPEDMPLGRYESLIVVGTLPFDAGTFDVSIEVAHRLSLAVIVPFISLEAVPGVPPLIPGEEANLSLTLINRGTLPAVADVEALVRVPGSPHGERLTSGAVELPRGSTQTLAFPWTPPSPGEFLLETRLTAGDYTANLSVPFAVGRPHLIPVSASAGKAGPGGVLPLAFAVRSDWNVPLPSAHAEARLIRDGAVVKEMLSVTTAVPARSSVEMPLYLETAGLAYGDYQLELVLVSDAGKDTYPYTLTLGPGKASLMPTGLASGTAPKADRLKLLALSAWAALVSLAALTALSIIRKRARGKTRKKGKVVRKKKTEMKNAGQ